MAQMDDKSLLSAVVTREQVEKFDDVALLRDMCMQLSEQLVQCYGQITSAREEVEVARGEMNALSQQRENLAIENAALQVEYNAVRSELRTKMQVRNRIEMPSGQVAQLQEEMHKKQTEIETLLQRQQLIDQEQIALLQEQLQGVGINDREEDNLSMRSATEGLHRHSPVALIGRQTPPFGARIHGQLTSAAGALGERLARYGRLEGPGLMQTLARTPSVISVAQHRPQTQSTRPFQYASLANLPESRSQAFCPNAIKLMSKLDKFSGKVSASKMLFTDWLKDFNVRLETLGIDAQSTVGLNVLRDNLCDAALQAFDLMPTQGRSYQSAVEMLMSKFDKTKSFNADYFAFVNMRQKANESVDEFARQLQLHAQQVFRFDDERTVNRMLAGQFVAGLSDDTMQDKVSLERSLTDFVDVVSFARHIEQHYSEMQALREGNPQGEGMSVTPTAMTPKQQATPMTCWTCGEVGHRSNACPGKTQGEAESNQNQLSSNGQSGQRRANQARQKTAQLVVPAASNAQLSLFASYPERDPGVTSECKSQSVTIRSLLAMPQVADELFDPEMRVTQDQSHLGWRKRRRRRIRRLAAIGPRVKPPEENSCAVQMGGERVSTVTNAQSPLGTDRAIERMREVMDPAPIDDVLMSAAEDCARVWSFLLPEPEESWAAEAGPCQVIAEGDASVPAHY
uniref:CCHC-type domain-containing protein n=1 Tax=Plectus sambesii TaxID=2011161 RepID=A0A914XKF4_9BILA